MKFGHALSDLITESYTRAIFSRPVMSRDRKIKKKSLRMRNLNNYIGT